MIDHEEISALIPWYVNDTIDENRRKLLETHLSECTACRAELQLERRVHQAMMADQGVEYMPASSLKRLHARLDALEVSGGARDAEPAAARPLRRGVPWQRALAASVAIVAAAGLVALHQWPQAPVLARNYVTVTSPLPRAPDEVVRVVFAPTITLIELQAILDEAQLRIVAGPTEAGVYSLAANSDRPVMATLEMLRKHAAVRFAESTQPAAPEPR